jgi:hypothetical protein
MGVWRHSGVVGALEGGRYGGVSVWCVCVIAFVCVYGVNAGVRLCACVCNGPGEQTWTYHMPLIPHTVLTTLAMHHQCHGALEGLNCGEESAISTKRNERAGQVLSNMMACA